MGVDVPHKRLECWVQHRPLHVVAVRVGAVHHDLQTLLGTSFHDQHQ